MYTTKTKKGFTLAETLLTLMILGVIAAMTIPSLMYNARNRDNVARLKKIVGVLSVATSLIQVQEGPVDGWEWADEKNIIDLYRPKVSIMQECGKAKGCFSEDVTALNGGSLEDYYNSTEYYKFILTDGMMIAFKPCNGGCSPADYGLDPASELLGGFVIDINGLRSPNQGGKDIFYLGLVREKGIQAGGAYSTNGCSNRSSNGLNCAALVIKEDKISYW